MRRGKRSFGPSMVTVLVGRYYLAKWWGSRRQGLTTWTWKNSYMLRETRITSVYDINFLMNNSGHIVQSCIFCEACMDWKLFHTVTYEFDQIKALDEGTNKTILPRVTFYLERKKTCILVSIIHALSIN